MSRRSLSSPSQWPTSRLIRSTSERCQVLGGAAAVEPRRTDVRRYGGECNLFRPCRGCLAFSVFASHGLRRGLLSGAPAGAAWLFLCSPPTACAVGYFPAPLPGLPVRNRFRTFRDQELAGLSWTISLAVYRECDLNKCVKFGAVCGRDVAQGQPCRFLILREPGSLSATSAPSLEDLSTEESGLGKPQACAKKASNLSVLRSKTSLTSRARLRPASLRRCWLSLAPATPARRNGAGTSRTRRRKSRSSKPTSSIARTGTPFPPIASSFPVRRFISVSAWTVIPAASTTGSSSRGGSIRSVPWGPFHHGRRGRNGLRAGATGQGLAANHPPLADDPCPRRGRQLSSGIEGGRRAEPSSRHKPDGHSCQGPRDPG